MRVPTILISDDDLALVAALSRTAQSMGLAVVTDTSSDVVALARLYQPDLILLDTGQRTDGRDLLRSLKTDPETAAIRVVVITGPEDEHRRRQCLELGAVDVVAKRFDIPFVVMVSRLLLEAREVPQQSNDQMQYQRQPVGSTLGPRAPDGQEDRHGLLMSQRLSLDSVD